MGSGVPSLSRYAHYARFSHEEERSEPSVRRVRAWRAWPTLAVFIRLITLTSYASAAMPVRASGAPKGNFKLIIHFISSEAGEETEPMLSG